MAPSETVLWEELRNRRLAGYKFLRQHLIVYNPNGDGSKYFVADFYCDFKKTVLEPDGPIHESNAENDQYRDSELRLHILRIKNDELVDIPEVLKKIETYLKSIK